MEPKTTEAPTSVEVVEPVAVAEEKPKKEKKPRSEAQQAATMKALEAMTIARKARAEKQKERKVEVAVAKKVIEKKIVDENIPFATKKEIEAMRKELQDLRTLHEATKMVKEHVPAKQERIVERVFERVPTATAAPAKLSGYELLDKVFFNK